MESGLVALQSLLNQYFFVLILIGGILFSLHVPKRSHYLLRLIGGMAVASLITALTGAGIQLLITWVDFSPWMLVAVEMLRAVLLFGMSTAILFLLYRYTPINALYVGVLGYTIEHLVVLSSYCVRYYLFPQSRTAGALLFFGLFAAAFVAEYLLVRHNREGFANINNRSAIVQSTLFLFGSVVLSVLSYDYIISNDALVGTPAVFIVSTFGILMCVNILIGLLDSFRIKRIETELLKTRELWHEDVRRYELSKETVDVLNYRYHDLKKRMALLTQDTAAGEQIRRALDDYDDSFRTGNEAMDVVLTEKSILCRQNGITMTAMADGNCFASLGQVDLYSILGNLIENAIEYLKSVPDPDKRVIALSIRQEGEMDVIHTENYLDKTPKQFDDLPLTTKPDAEDHGFGLKSVRYTLKQYGGILRITTDDHLFSATAAMPRNESSHKKEKASGSCN